MPTTGVIARSSRTVSGMPSSAVYAAVIAHPAGTPSTMPSTAPTAPSHTPNER
jgi:hypothetical protein